jgi:hypothetical protein
MVIDKESYKLGDDNYYKIECDKQQIVIGHTGRKDMYHYLGWTNRHGGKYKKTATFTINKEGNVYQHYDPKYYSDFVSLYNIAPFTISITLENVGWLQKDDINDRYYDWLGHNYILEDDDIVTQRWRNKDHWDRYTPEQMESLRNLTDKLCNDFGIKNDCISHTVFNEDVDIYEGITFKSNYYQEATDISPAFDMEVFKTTV